MVPLCQLAELFGYPVDVLVAFVRKVAFWTAVAFPAVYALLPLHPAFPELTGRLLVTGLGIHALALVLGHRYNHLESGVPRSATRPSRSACRRSER